MTARPATSADVPAIAARSKAAYWKYVAAIGKKPAPMTAAFAEAVAREQGLPEVRLYTKVVMSKNFAFYRRLRYTETGAAASKVSNESTR